MVDGGSNGSTRGLPSWTWALVVGVLLGLGTWVIGVTRDISALSTMVLSNSRAVDKMDKRIDNMEIRMYKDGLGGR
jgi:hypothetical protein